MGPQLQTGSWGRNEPRRDRHGDCQWLSRLRCRISSRRMESTADRPTPAAETLSRECPVAEKNLDPYPEGAAATHSPTIAALHHRSFEWRTEATVSGLRSAQHRCWLTGSLRYHFRSC